MSNWIYFDPPSQKLGFAAPKKNPTKDALGKIAQLIPGPVLGAYGAALATLPLFTVAEQLWVGLGMFILGMAGTFWMVGWQIGKGIKTGRHQLVYVSAFSVWAYSLTGKTALPWIYHPGVAAVLPIIASFIYCQIPLPKRESK